MLSHRLPLLVTGVAGVAGFNAFHHFHAQYPGQVFGIRPRETWPLRGPGIIAQDAEDPAGMAALFDHHGFRSVLNAAGNCALKSCELNPAMARIANVASAAVVVENVLRLGCRLVTLSSDLVFPGRDIGVYVESDPVDPVTIYGKTMVEAEALVTSRCPEAAILRIPLPMGPSFNEHAGAIDWIKSRFRANRPATLYFDEVRSVAYCDDLNTVFGHFLANDVAGLFHCGAPRAITLYEIGQIVNRVGGHEPGLLNGCPRLDAGPMPPRAGNVAMDSSKLLKVLGFQPFQSWPVGADICPTDRDWHWQRNEGEIGSLEMVKARLYRYPPTLASIRHNSPGPIRAAQNGCQDRWIS